MLKYNSGELDIIKERLLLKADEFSWVNNVLRYDLDKMFRQMGISADMEILSGDEEGTILINSIQGKTPAKNGKTTISLKLGAYTLTWQYNLKCYIGIHPVENVNVNRDDVLDTIESWIYDYI